MPGLHLSNLQREKQQELQATIGALSSSFSSKGTWSQAGKKFGVCPLQDESLRGASGPKAQLPREREKEGKWIKKRTLIRPEPS